MCSRYACATKLCLCLPPLAVAGPALQSIFRCSATQRERERSRAHHFLEEHRPAPPLSAQRRPSNQVREDGFTPDHRGCSSARRTRPNGAFPGQTAAHAPLTCSCASAMLPSRMIQRRVRSLQPRASAGGRKTPHASSPESIPRRELCSVFLRTSWRRRRLRVFGRGETRRDRATGARLASVAPLPARAGNEKETEPAWRLGNSLSPSARWSS